MAKKYVLLQTITQTTWTVILFEVEHFTLSKLGINMPNLLNYVIRREREEAEEEQKGTRRIKVFSDLRLEEIKVVK